MEDRHILGEGLDGPEISGRLDEDWIPFVDEDPRQEVKRLL